ncbi:MAG: ammonium transporter [bacterium]
MKRFLSKISLFFIPLLILVIPALSHADATNTEPARLSAGDTAFVLIATALVMLMTPGLALFYGGMVKKKNVLATIMQSFILLAVISIQWVLWGYTLSFGPDIHGIIGSLKWFGLDHVGLSPDPVYAPTIPHEVFMIFQMMFAVITPGLITGAFAERMKFKTFLLFAVLWATLVYDPIAHWVWGDGGWIHKLGALDFAGGTVVHISSAISALAAVIVIGKRHNYGKEHTPPHNLTMTIIGASLLWFGWFGFNAGSALAANAIAGSAFVVTNIAAAGATLGWLFAEWIRSGKPTMLGAVSGAVAGLVAITPAAGYVGPISAIIIGFIAGILCYFAVTLKPKLGYDDALDVVGVHGVGGTFGALATGLFASITINAAGANGLFYGNPKQLLIQLIAVIVTIVYGFIVTFIILKVLDWAIGLRVSQEEEIMGLDITQHGEEGYNM